MGRRVFTFRRTLVQTRKRGHSAVRAAAYRFGLAGESRFAARDGTHAVDYSNRGGIDRSDCALPDGADESWRDPLTWAHRIEAVDYRKNSRQFRDDVVAIPLEMVRSGQAVTAIATYAQRLARRWRTPVHWVIHDIGGPNPHAHVVYAGRPLDGPGRFAKHRDREQDSVSNPGRGQVSIAELHSQFWIDVGAELGYEFDFSPQGERAQTHIGPRAWAVEKKSTTTEFADAIGTALGDRAPDPRTLHGVATIESDALSVTEARTLDRESSTAAMRRARRPLPIRPPAESQPPRRALAETAVPETPVLTPSGPALSDPARMTTRGKVEPLAPRPIPAPAPEPARRELDAPMMVTAPAAAAEPPRPALMRAEPAPIPAQWRERAAQTQRVGITYRALTTAVTAKSAGAAGETLIRHELDPQIEGIGPATNERAISTLRTYTSRADGAPGLLSLFVPPSVTQRLERWRAWWKQESVRLVPELISSLWHVHWRESEQKRVEAEAHEHWLEETLAPDRLNRVERERLAARQAAAAGEPRTEKTQRRGPTPGHNPSRGGDPKR